MGLGLAKAFTAYTENRKEIKLAKIEAKTDKSVLKAQTKQVAYQNGIDPTSNALSGVTGMLSSVGNTVSNVYGFGMKSGARDGNQYGAVLPTTGGSSTILYIVVFAIIAIFAFKK